MILASQDRIAEYTAQGWWGTRTIDDHFRDVAARHPQREAVVDAPNRALLTDGAPRRLSYSQLADEVARMAAVLHGRGLRRDDIVVVQLVNSVEQYVVYLACLRLGLVVSPVPVQYREFELRHILALTQARAVVTATRVGKHAAAAMWVQLAQECSPHGRLTLEGPPHEGLPHEGLPQERLPHERLPHERLPHADPLQARGPHEHGQQHGPLEHVLCFGSAVPRGAHSLDVALAGHLDLQAAEHAAMAAATTANHIATLCWTSGTEAAPKGVPRSHNEWLIVAPSIIEAAELQPGARLLNPFPLVNMAGWSTCVAAWLRLEGTVVQHHPFDLAVFLQQLRDERIDYTVCPPAILNQLLQQPALLDGIDFTRLSRIGSGSAPLSEWMVRGWAERGVQIVNYFGSNEGAALTGSPRDIPDPGLRAKFFARAGVERPLPDVTYSHISTARKIRTRLVDPETEEEVTQTGVPGELRVSGPTVFCGYFRAPEQTASAFDAQGFYRSGDLFEIAGDEGQFYRFVGRSKDIVVRGGMKISALEVEQLLMACPGVQDAVVIGQPDDVLGERVCACVVAANGADVTLANLVAFLRDERQVAVYKLPEHLLLLPALPRNPVGKVLKRELRAMFAKFAKFDDSGAPT